VVSARIQHRSSEGNDGFRSVRVRFQAWFGRIGNWGIAGGSAASGVVTGVGNYEPHHNVGDAVATGTASAGDSFLSGWAGSAFGGFTADGMTTADAWATAGGLGMGLTDDVAVGSEIGSLAGPAGIGLQWWAPPARAGPPPPPKVTRPGQGGP
jgi:hypothetical protein